MRTWLFIEALNLSSYLEVRIGGEVALQALVALVLDRRLGLQSSKVSNAISDTDSVSLNVHQHWHFLHSTQLFCCSL